MQYSRLGNTGLFISRLSFGAMTFGTDVRFPAVTKVDMEGARRLVGMCLDAGINYFDTADGYAQGQSETMLGECLQGRRSGVVISTKVGFRSGETITQAGLSRRHILASCDASLKRLQTDYIDLYIVHREDRFTPIEESLEALNDLVRAGKVRYLGYSNWSAWKAATAVRIQTERGWARFISGQMYYSLLGRDVEHEVVPFMQYAGLGMTVWSPLAGGFLSGKYTRENLREKENRLSGFDFLPYDKEFGFRLLDKIREIAAPHDASVAQISLAWLLTKPVVASVIIGATKAEQLEDNLKSVAVKLADSEAAELDAKRAIKQGTELAVALEGAGTGPDTTPAAKQQQGVQPAVAASLKKWHAMVAQGDLSELSSILHPKAVFRSPMAHTPYASAQAVQLILGTVVKVFEDFSYHRELASEDGLSVVLEFSARVGDKALKGIDLIQFDAEGKIVDFEVLVRPMSGLQALGDEMGKRLAPYLSAYKAAKTQ